MKKTPARRLPPVPEQVASALDNGGSHLAPFMATDGISTGTSELMDRVEQEMDAGRSMEQGVLEAALYRETTTHTLNTTDAPETLQREGTSQYLIGEVGGEASETMPLLGELTLQPLQQQPEHPETVGLTPPDPMSWAAPRTSPRPLLDERRLPPDLGKPLEMLIESRSPTPLESEDGNFVSPLNPPHKCMDRNSPSKQSISANSNYSPRNPLTRPSRKRASMHSFGDGSADPWGCVAQQLSRLQRNVEALTRAYRSKESDAPSREMQQAFLENSIDYSDKRPSVEVTVEILEVSDFNLATGLFHACFNVSLDWEEPEFVEGVHYYQNQRSKRFEISNVVLEDSQAFNPRVDILNAADTLKVDTTEYHIHRLIQRGSAEKSRFSVWLTKSYKFNGLLKCPHPDGTRFPWDMQRLPIQVKARPMEGQTTLGKDREIRLVEPMLRKIEALEGPKSKRSALLRVDALVGDPRLRSIEAHKWSMEEKMSIGNDKTVANFNIGEMEVCAFGGSDPAPEQYHVEIVVIRAWTTYIFDFIIQMLLVTISLCTAWVPFNDDTTINKLSISMTIVLAIVFFATTKPPAIQDLTYNTLQDSWDVCMLSATVIVCIENVFVYIQCYGMDRSEYEDWVLGVGSFLSQAACEESSVGASNFDSWFVLFMLVTVICIFLGMLTHAALYRLRFLLNVKEELESCDLTVDDQIGWQTSLWQTAVPSQLKEGATVVHAETLHTTEPRPVGGVRMSLAGLAVNTTRKAAVGVVGSGKIAQGLNPTDQMDQLVHCIARHGMPMLYIWPRFWLAFSQGMCRCRCRKRYIDEPLSDVYEMFSNHRPSKMTTATRGSLFLNPPEDGLSSKPRQGQATGEEPPDQKWLDQVMGLRPVLPPGETVRILDCGTGEVGFYEYCWRPPREGAKDLLYSDKSSKLQLDTTKTFIEEFVLPQDGPERFAKEIKSRFFPPGTGPLRSPAIDGLSTVNLTVGPMALGTTQLHGRKTKILFGPTGQNRQRLIQSKQSALAVSAWVEQVEDILNRQLKDDTGIVTDLLLFIPSDQDEATYELVATEYLVQNGDLSVRSLQTDLRGAPFAGFELSQAMSRGGTRRKNGGAIVFSLMEFLREFQDLMDSQIDQVFMLKIFRSASHEEGLAEAQALVKAIRESEPLMRSLIKNRLFNGTLSAGGGSCQITVKPDHEDRPRMGATSSQPGIIRQSSSNQVVRTSEFQSIPVGNKTPLTTDTLGYAMFPRTEPISEDRINTWRNHVDAAIQSMDLAPKLKGNLRGVYIGISAVYHAAKAAGCAEELLPKAAFLERLNEKLQHLLEDPPPKQMKNGEEAYDHRLFSNLVLVATLVKNVLADTAWIVCKREWRAQPASLLESGDDVGELPKYVATWSLGFYLSQSI